MAPGFGAPWQKGESQVGTTRHLVGTLPGEKCLESQGSSRLRVVKKPVEHRHEYSCSFVVDSGPRRWFDRGEGMESDLQDLHPSGSPVVPILRYVDAPAAIDWLREAFGFERNFVIPEQGDMILQPQLKFGRGVLVLGTARLQREGDERAGSPSGIRSRSRQRCMISWS